MAPSTLYSLRQELQVVGDGFTRLEEDQNILIKKIDVELKKNISSIDHELAGLVEQMHQLDFQILEGDSDLIDASTTDGAFGNNQVFLNRGTQQINQATVKVMVAFQNLENLASQSQEQIMRAEERVTEYQAVKIQAMTEKISDEQASLRQRIKETQGQIDALQHEKAQANEKINSLQKTANGLRESRNQLNVARNVTIGTTSGGSVLGAIGLVLSPILPPVGIPLLLAGAGAAVGSGVAFSDISHKLASTEGELSRNHNLVTELDTKLQTLPREVCELQCTAKKLEEASSEVKALESKSQALYERAANHIDVIRQVKDAVSIGGMRIAELNADIKLGYRGTRAELASSLGKTLEKYKDSRKQLFGRDEDIDDANIGRSLVLIKDIATKANQVLAIMGDET